MAFIDGTVVNIALPALQESLRATVVDVQWVIEAYSLLLSALLLLGGSLGDRYGRRRIFATGVALFMADGRVTNQVFAGRANGSGMKTSAEALRQPLMRFLGR